MRNSASIAVLAGGLGLVGGGNASAEIIHTVLNQTIDDSTLYLDINEDGFSNFKIGENNGASLISVPVGGNGFIWKTDPWAGTPNFKMTGFAFDASSQYVGATAGFDVAGFDGWPGYFRRPGWNTVNLQLPGHFKYDDQDLVIGFALLPGVASNGFNFGWMRVWADTNPAETSFLILKEYAYEDQRDAPIHAGDTGAAPPAIPEPSTFALMALGASTALAYRRVMHRAKKKAAEK